MNDPHVNTLFYSLKTPENTSYKECPPIVHEDTTHKFTLDGDTLVCELKVHFPDVKSARSLIDPELRAWELNAALDNGREEILFEYKNANVIDQNPPASNSVSIIAQSVECTLKVSADLKIHVTKSNYPTPPVDFFVSPEVETFWHRYNMYLQGKEPLLSMAYFCLSRLETLAGKMNQIPSTFFIELAVLKKLGYLTSKKGDLKTARKGKGHTFQPLTSDEQKWIESCIKIIIRRLGDTSPSPTMITMAHLPQI